MAIIKTDNSHYTNIANAIRSKSGTETQFKPSEMPQGVEEVYEAGYEKGKAEVIPAKEEQEKTIEITKNSTTEVLPDDGKTLSKVTVDVNVEGEPVFVTERGVMYKEHVELPETVTVLSGDSFKNAFNLRSIIIPSSVTAFGDGCFGGCVLDSFVIKDGCTASINFNGLAYFTYMRIYEGGYVYLPSTLSSVMHMKKLAPYRSDNKTATIEIGDNWNLQGFDVAYFDLSVECLLNIGEALYDRTGLEPYTLIIGATNIEKLTDEQKAIFTNKNWTLA